MEYLIKLSRMLKKLQSATKEPLWSVSLRGKGDVLLVKLPLDSRTRLINTCFLLGDFLKMV